MPHMSDLALGLAQSGIRRIMNAAITRPHVIRLEVGEPRFATPRHIVDAAYEGALAGYTKYTANWGIPELRTAIAERVTLDTGRAVPPEMIGVTVGAVGAIYGIVRVLVDPGDEVLIPDPGWPNYRMLVTACAARPVDYHLREYEGFIPSREVLEAAVSPRTKAIIINTPSNPLGTVIPAGAMSELVAFARDHDLWVISDEVYEKIVFFGEHVSALRFDTDERVVVASGFSKSYAMTGWRIGYAVAPEPVIAQLAKMQESYVSCTPGPSQKAAEAALRGPQDCVVQMRDAYDQNRKLATSLLDRLGITYHMPAGAFYLWTKIGCADSMEFALTLLDEEQVAVAPGSTFGPTGEGYIRLSLASAPEDIAEGIERLGRFMQRRGLLPSSPSEVSS